MKHRIRWENKNFGDIGTLRVSIDSHFLISKGRVFHNRGAQTEKTHEPYVFRLNFGSSRSNCVDDLNIRIQRSLLSSVAVF